MNWIYLYIYIYICMHSQNMHLYLSINIERYHPHFRICNVLLGYSRSLSSRLWKKCGQLSAGLSSLPTRIQGNTQLLWKTSQRMEQWLSRLAQSSAMRRESNRIHVLLGWSVGFSMMTYHKPASYWATYVSNYMHGSFWCFIWFKQAYFCIWAPKGWKLRASQKHVSCTCPHGSFRLGKKHRSWMRRGVELVIQSRFWIHQRTSWHSLCSSQHRKKILWSHILKRKHIHVAFQLKVCPSSWMLLLKVTTRGTFMESTRLPCGSDRMMELKHPFTWSFLPKHHSNELCVPPSKATFNLSFRGCNDWSKIDVGHHKITGIDKTKSVQLNECSPLCKIYI